MLSPQLCNFESKIIIVHYCPLVNFCPCGKILQQQCSLQCNQPSMSSQVAIYDGCYIGMGSRPMARPEWPIGGRGVLEAVWVDLGGWYRLKECSRVNRDDFKLAEVFPRCI
jgi:hypothetical protein